MHHPPRLQQPRKQKQAAIPQELRNYQFGCGIKMAMTRKDGFSVKINT